MATAPIYKAKGNKVMERTGADDADGVKGNDAKPKGDAKEPEKKADAKAEDKGGDDGAGEKKADDKGAGDKGHADRHKSEREGLYKKHEAERRDNHNNFREALRLMHSRHQKDHTELNTRHMADLASQGLGQTEGQQPVADTAEGGGAQSPASA